MEKITWASNEITEPDARFGKMLPKEWEVFTFPPAWKHRPWIAANFVADRNGLVVGKTNGGKTVTPEHLLGKRRFPSNRKCTPDPAVEADQRTMRILRTLADGVMWGRKTLTHQPKIIPDLMGDYRTLHAFRDAHSMGMYPPLILVTDSGELDFSLPAFRTPGLRTVVLTNEATAKRTAPLAAGTNTQVIGFGAEKLNTAKGLEWLLKTEGMNVVLCEGGHSLIESLHADGLLDEVFVTTTNVALDPAKVVDPKYMFDFAKEGARLVACGTAGKFEFRRWRFNERGKE